MPGVHGPLVDAASSDDSADPGLVELVELVDWVVAVASVAELDVALPASSASSGEKQPTVIAAPARASRKALCMRAESVKTCPPH